MKNTEKRSPNTNCNKCLPYELAQAKADNSCSEVDGVEN